MVVLLTFNKVLLHGAGRNVVPRIWEDLNFNTFSFDKIANNQEGRQLQ